MGQSTIPLPTFETESATLTKVQTIKVSVVPQATETPGPSVFKPTTSKQIVVARVQPVECLAAPPAAAKTTDETPHEAADNTDKLKYIPPEPTVREKKLTTEEHVSPQEAETLKEESKKPLSKAVITKPVLKSENVQLIVRTTDDPKQAIDSPDLTKLPTVEVSLGFKETCTSLVMYTTNVTVN